MEDLVFTKMLFQGFWIYLYLLNGLKLSASFYVLKLITLAIIATFTNTQINKTKKSNTCQTKKINCFI